MRTNGMLAGDLTRKHWNEKIAARALKAWHASGMSLNGFARASGVSAERLRRWGKRIQGGEERGTAGGPPMAFLPAAVTVAARAVVRFPGGVDLEGDATALPAEWVAALARALVKA